MKYLNFHKGKPFWQFCKAYKLPMAVHFFIKVANRSTVDQWKQLRIFNSCLVWLLVYGFADACTFPLRDIAVLLITWRCALAPIPIWCYRVNLSFSYRYQRMHWIRRLRKPLHHQWRASRAKSSMSREGHVLQHHWVVPLQVQAGLPWRWKVMLV